MSRSNVHAPIAADCGYPTDPAYMLHGTGKIVPSRHETPTELLGGFARIVYSRLGLPLVVARPADWLPLILFNADLHLKC